MEVFTFLRMGGSHDRIEIYLITSPDKSRSAARKELRESLASFDAEKARCFLEKDRQRMLAAVEASFGDCKEFNIKMRNVFESRLVRGLSWEMDLALTVEGAQTNRQTGWAALRMLHRARQFKGS